MRPNPGITQMTRYLSEACKTTTSVPDSIPDYAGAAQMLEDLQSLLVPLVNPGFAPIDTGPDDSTEE